VSVITDTPRRQGRTGGAKRGSEAGAPTPVRRRARLRARLRRDWPLLLMMAPGVVYFLVFQYVAMAGNVIAFKQYIPFLGFAGSPWAGFSQFQTLFADPAFWAATWNTIELAALQLVFFVPVPLMVALLLHSLLSSRLRKFVQAVVYLPHFLSWVIAVALFDQVLGGTGLVNGLVSDNGQHVINIMSNPSLFKPMMVIELIWKDCGWATIIFTAALFQIEGQHYEAAALDGAGPWRRFWHVTLPGIRPVLVLILIMRVGDIFNVGFDQIMQQRQAFGGASADVIDTYIYNVATQNGEWSVAAAAGIFKAVIALALVVTANKVAHKMGEAGVYQ